MENEIKIARVFLLVFSENDAMRNPSTKAQTESKADSELCGNNGGRNIEFNIKVKKNADNAFHNMEL